VNREAPPDRLNAASALIGVFPKETLRAAGLRAAMLLPRDEFRFTPAHLQEVVSFRQPFDPVLEVAREALRRPSCHFGMDYRLGYFADTSFLDEVILCTRLEAFRAAELLSQDGDQEIVPSLTALLQIPALLAAEPHVACRMTAAHLRSDALSVLQACAERPHLSADTLRQLADVLAAQLADWPSDGSAWFGDRALTLHTYEVIRAGYLSAIPTDREVEFLRSEGNLWNLAGYVRTHIDRDELFYLRTMRKVLASCSKPYYQRRDVLLDIERELQRRQDRSDYPRLAARLFLAGMDEAMEGQARDRARTEAWAIAISLASGREHPPYRINPVNGIAYAVLEEEQRIRVLAGEDIAAVVARPTSR
jgi:hypothetical protein